VNWPPGSTTKRLADIRVGDEILVDLTYRTVRSWQDTPEGRVVHFERSPSRLYTCGLDRHVRIWDQHFDAIPSAMAINRRPPPVI
jgi:hypothetical protein